MTQTLWKIPTVLRRFSGWIPGIVWSSFCVPQRSVSCQDVRCNHPPSQTHLLLWCPALISARHPESWSDGNIQWLSEESGTEKPQNVRNASKSDSREIVRIKFSHLNQFWYFAFSFFYLSSTWRWKRAHSVSKSSHVSQDQRSFVPCLKQINS